MNTAFDLVVLLPDAHWRAVLEAMFERPAALGIRALTCKFIVHPQRDPGVRTSGTQLLSGFVGKADAALMVLDFEGAGFHGSPLELQDSLATEIERHWGTEGLALVVDPELETWLIGAVRHLPALVGASEDVRGWMADQGIWPEGRAKPHRPKEALERWFDKHKVRPTSSIWRDLAGRASLKPEPCEHDSYRRLVAWLRERFGPR